MQVVIDIDEKTYDDFIYYWVKDSDILRAVRNGTQLPKGHGRLIDENDLKTLFELDDRLWWGNAVNEFKDLPTIIEADKGE